MILLKLVQGDYEKNLALFDSLEEGRDFLKGFGDNYLLEESDGFDQEYILMKGLPDYFELEYRGNIIPFSRFSFPAEERVRIFREEVPNLSQPGSGMVDTSLRVDAYLVNSRQMRDYIEKREENFSKISSYLTERSYQVQRAYLGSEDGEAILVKKEGGEWRFLTHLDPFFVEEEDIIGEIEDLMEELY